MKCRQKGHSKDRSWVLLRDILLNKIIKQHNNNLIFQMLLSQMDIKVSHLRREHLILENRQRDGK